LAVAQADSLRPIVGELKAARDRSTIGPQATSLRHKQHAILSYGFFGGSAFF